MGLPHIRSCLPESETRTTIDELFRTYSPTVASLGLAMLGNSAEAEDLVQDVFVRAWRSLDKLQHPAAVKSWLMTIAVRVAQTRLQRRRLTRIFFPAHEPDLEHVAAPDATPDERVYLARLFRVLEKLPTDLR